VGSYIILKTTLSCEFDDCLLYGGGYKSGMGEFTIDEDSVKFIVEYHFEQCAKDGLIFLKKISDSFLKFCQILSKNISDKWKFADKFFMRVAKQIFIPCDEEHIWFVKD